jgi:hypothetical protein
MEPCSQLDGMGKGECADADALIAQQKCNVGMDAGAY